MSEDDSQVFNERTILFGVDISETSNSSFFIGMSSIAGLCETVSVTDADDFGVVTLKGFLGRLKSLRLKGMSSYCLP